MRGKAYGQRNQVARGVVAEISPTTSLCLTGKALQQGGRSRVRAPAQVHHRATNPAARQIRCQGQCPVLFDKSSPAESGATVRAPSMKRPSFGRSSNRAAALGQNRSG